MASLKKSSIRQKLLLVYMLAGLVGFLLIIFENVYILGNTIVEQFHDVVPFVFSQAVITGGIFYWITVWRIGKQMECDPAKVGEAARKELFFKIVRFPGQMFVFSVIFMIFESIAFHTYDYFFLTDDKSGYWIWFIQNFINEQSIGLIYTMTVYSALNRFLRPILIKFQQHRLQTNLEQTYYRKVLLVVISILLITITNLISLYFGTMDDKGAVHLSVGKVLLVIFILLGISIVFVRYTILEPIFNIKQVTTQLNQIALDKGNIHRPIPITTADEVGQLISAYNHIQHRIKSIYDDLEEELKLAFNVQSQLLAGKEFVLYPINITAFSKPAREVGGDFYDIIQIDEQRVIIVIGDVSGKGLPAALLMSAMIGLIRGRIQQSQISPKLLLQDLNELLIPILSDGMYVTVGFAMIDLASQKVTYASAGHLPPLIKFQDGTIAYLEQSTFPLGIEGQVTYEDMTVSLENVQTLLLYTDGLLEQKNSEGEIYGFQRLEDSFQTNERSEWIFNEIASFANGTELTDDVTIVRIEFE